MVAGKIYRNLRSDDRHGLVDYVVVLTGVTIIYVGLAKLSLALASIHPSATPVWPPTGYALGTYYCWGIESLQPSSLGLHCQPHNRWIDKHLPRNRYQQRTRELSRRVSHQSIL
jgi:hypothetical protein